MALPTAPIVQPTSKRVPPACDGYLITHRPCIFSSWAFGPDCSTPHQQKISPSFSPREGHGNGAQNLPCQHDCEQIKKGNLPRTSTIPFWTSYHTDVGDAQNQLSVNGNNNPNPILPRRQCRPSRPSWHRRT
jgi:hypothetical protein